jgi:hypothetical protein
MVVVPILIPLTTPVALTVATDVVVDAQVPPGTAFVKVIAAPGHTVDPPMIEAGDGTTLTVI